MTRAIRLNTVLMFLSPTHNIDEQGFGSVIYAPAHMHNPGDNIPCSASWLIIF